MSSKKGIICAQAGKVLIAFLILGLSGFASGQGREELETRGIGESTLVQVLLDESGEAYLAGPDGMTLYTMKKDRPGIPSKCTRGCAENWPPLVAGQHLVAPRGLVGKIGTLNRRMPDHRTQVTYQGQPLYYWSRDQLPGDITGDGIGDIWSVARPLGQGVDKKGTMVIIQYQ